MEYELCKTCYICTSPMIITYWGKKIKSSHYFVKKALLLILSPTVFSKFWLLFQVKQCSSHFVVKYEWMFPFLRLITQILLLHCTKVHFEEITSVYNQGRRRVHDCFLLLLCKSSIWFREEHIFKVIIYFCNTSKCAANYVISFEVWFHRSKDFGTMKAGKSAI